MISLLHGNPSGSFDVFYLIEIYFVRTITRNINIIIYIDTRKFDSFSSAFPAIIVFPLFRRIIFALLLGTR